MPDFSSYNLLWAGDNIELISKTELGVSDLELTFDLTEASNSDILNIPELPVQFTIYNESSFEKIEATEVDISGSDITLTLLRDGSGIYPIGSTVKLNVTSEIPNRINEAIETLNGYVTTLSEYLFISDTTSATNTISYNYILNDESSLYNYMTITENDIDVTRADINVNCVLYNINTDLDSTNLGDYLNSEYHGLRICNNSDATAIFGLEFKSIPYLEEAGPLLIPYNTWSISNIQGFLAFYPDSSSTQHNVFFTPSVSGDDDMGPLFVNVGGNLSVSDKLIIEGDIIAEYLPTTDPVVSGQFWVDESGFVRMSIVP